jgi:hypothetical protein
LSGDHILTTPQRDSLTGGVYTLKRGGQPSSLVSLLLLPHGAMTTAEAAAVANTLGLRDLGEI